MSLPELTTNLNHVRSLPDKPILSANDLKSVFDQAPNEIKDYINQTLLSAIENAITEATVIVQNVLTSTSTTNALSAKQGKVLKDTVDGKAPISHGSASTNYGIGAGDWFGHVALVDNTNASTYQQGYALAAHQGYVLQQNINRKAPTSHASAGITYGIGTGSAYGHVKVIQNTDTSEKNDGEALGAYQGYWLKQRVNEKAPISHGSSSATYGLGASGWFGHVALVDNTNSSTYQQGYALAAHQGYVLKQLIDNLSTQIGVLQENVANLQNRVAILEGKVG